MTSSAQLASPETPASTSPDPRLRSLPPSAREKFDRLRRTEMRARALIDGLLDEMQGVRDRRDEAVRDLARFDRLHKPEAAFTYEENPDGTRKRVPAVFPERDAILQKIENFKSDLQHLAREQSAANVGFSTETILSWLLAQSAARFVAAPVPLIKPGKGETFLDALSANRKAQAARRDELSAAHNARRTIAEAKEAMRAEVTRIADRGRPDVANLFLGGAITWPTEALVASGPAGVVSATVTDALAVAVWANEEAVIQRLDAEIERRGDDATALSREAQAERVAECERALVDLQRREEGVIEHLEALGQHVPRLCADPLILLGIEVAR